MREREHKHRVAGRGEANSSLNREPDTELDLRALGP